MQDRMRLRERLENLRISEEEYHIDCRRLKKFGYSEEQSDRVILVPSSFSIVTAIILTDRQLKWQFTADEIVTMAEHRDGWKNLKAVLKTHAWFIQQGFTPGQIVRMTASESGAKHLAWVKKAYPELVKRNFSPVEIVALVTGSVWAGRVGRMSFVMPSQKKACVNAVNLNAFFRGGSSPLQWRQSREDHAFQPYKRTHACAVD